MTLLSLPIPLLSFSLQSAQYHHALPRLAQPPYVETETQEIKITGGTLPLLGEFYKADSEEWSGMAASHQDVQAELWSRQSEK